MRARMRRSRPCRGCMASSLPVLNGTVGPAFPDEGRHVLYRKRRVSTTVQRRPRAALVAVDRLHHVLEDGVEDLARLLRITIGEQLHRALEVGEQDRDLLALALEGGLRGENLLGEMLGGIRLWRAEPRLDAALCCRQRLATTPAELLAALIQKSTRRARRRERQPAFTAEAASLSVLRVASRTDYQRNSPSSFSAF